MKYGRVVAMIDGIVMVVMVMMVVIMVVMISNHCCSIATRTRTNDRVHSYSFSRTYRTENAECRIAAAGPKSPKAKGSN